jgi:hypothetical protein
MLLLKFTHPLRIPEEIFPANGAICQSYSPSAEAYHNGNKQAAAKTLWLVGVLKEHLKYERVPYLTAPPCYS